MFRRLASPLLAAAAMSLGANALAGAQAPRQPGRRPTAAQLVEPLGSPGRLDSSALAGYRWREIGPFRGGRTVAVAGSAARPMEYYMGTTGGGVFKTTDGGSTWTPITDRYFGGTIGAIRVAPSNPDVVYVGGGEYPIRGNTSHGDGVWKSTDAGRTWTNVGLNDTRHIADVLVHPTNPDLVYVGALGHVFGNGGERGVYRSRDGGRTWARVLAPRNDSTGVTDLVMDPTNPDVLYAAMWEAYRRPWLMNSGGTGSGIYKSTDGGETWREITRNPGLPRGLIGNVGLAVSGGKASRVWAIVEADSGGVFRSDDGGATWTLVNAERKLRQRAWYYSRLYADPRDTNVVYASNVAFQKSTDGGRTWRNIRAPHGDSHDLWIAPNDNQRLIEGNDGGANVSVNGGRTWTDQDYATAQFYHVTTTNHFPYRICGAQQDNSTLCGPSRKEGGIGIADWDDAGGGESGYIAARTDDPDIIFAGSYGGLLTRKDMRTGLERNVNAWPDNPMGHSAGDLTERFQWTFPIVTSPHDPNVLYAASQHLFRTTNEGESWTRISPDLSRNDPRTLGPSGGPITRDQTSVEYYGTIFTVAESPVTAGLIWAGTDDGRVHVTRNGGTTWQDVSPPGVPEWMRWSIVEPSPFAAGTAYLAGNRYQLDDFAPYLFRTTDYGRTWTRITTGIAPTEFTRVIRADPVRRGLLYAGTERGVWASWDDGASWQSLRLNLPPVPVHDLAVKEGDLVAGTHGRSFWILDDLSALRQMSATVVAKPAHLYVPRDAYRIQWGGGAGTNPASGAVVRYQLARAGQTVRLEFADARGRTIRSFTSRPDSATLADSLRGDSVRTARTDSLVRGGMTADSARRLVMRGDPGAGPGGDVDFEALARSAPRAPRAPNRAGLNAFAWDLRHPDAVRFDDMIMWAGGTAGPVSPPGTYRVRLFVDDALVDSAAFRVLKDPRSRATPADLQEQFALLLRIRERTSDANGAVRDIRRVRAQVNARRAQVPAAQRDAFARQADALLEALRPVEEALYQVRNQSSQDPLNYPIRLNNKIAALSGVVASTEARPTRQSRQVFEQLSGQLDAELVKLRQAITTYLVPLNATLRTSGMPAIEVPGPRA